MLVSELRKLRFIDLPKIKQMWDSKLNLIC